MQEMMAHSQRVPHVDLPILMYCYDLLQFERGNQLRGGAISATKLAPVRNISVAVLVPGA